MVLSFKFQGFQFGIVENTWLLFLRVQLYQQESAFHIHNIATNQLFLISSWLQVVNNNSSLIKSNTGVTRVIPAIS